MRQIIVGDVHGCWYTLLDLFDRLQLTAADQLIFVGDYIDRGPYSRQVWEALTQRPTLPARLVCLRGNHEQLLLDAWNGDPNRLAFFEEGEGLTTLRSFGANRVGDLPAAFIDFLSQLAYFYQDDQLIVAHGGLDFRQGLDPLLRPQQMLWIRNWYADLDYDWLANRYIVHGHTPVDRDLIESMADNFEQLRVINLDNGCVFTLPGKGHLCAFDFTQRQLHFVPRNHHDHPRR